MVVLQSYTHLLEREVLYPDADPRGRSNTIKLEYPVSNDKAASLVGLITKARFKVNPILSAIRHIRSMRHFPRATSLNHHLLHIL